MTERESTREMQEWSRKERQGIDKEQDHNGDAKFPKGAIHAETPWNTWLNYGIQWFSFVISRKQETTAAMKWETFLLIPVGLFRCSSLGIQGHHYQNLQKLLSIIILHSTAPVCRGVCVSLTRLGSNLCFTSFGFWGEWAVQLFYSVFDISISQDES